MDKKAIYAIVAVVVLVVAAAGAYIAIGHENTSDKEINIIGRVNTDGSAIVAKPDVVVSDLVGTSSTQGTDDANNKYFYDEVNKNYLVFHPEAWGGMIVGTPGPNSIQQIQMQQFVTGVLGLKFTMYTVGAELKDDTVYYNYAINSYDKMSNTPEIEVAIMWEPQCAIASVNGYSYVVTTNQLYPGHTCCVLAATHSWTSGHDQETVRFLAAYTEAVSKMNDAIENKVTNKEAYDQLMDIAVKNISFPASVTDAQKVQVIETAFEYVVYKAYDNTGSDPLSDLKKDVANLADDLYRNKNINKSTADLGFDSSAAFADKFVNSSFMAQAQSYKATGDEKSFDVTVAVINGDIHQLAIHYGMALGIFDQYGVNITLSGQPNGDGVAVALENGAAQIGFIGAPPMTIKVINSEYVTA